MSAKYRIKYWAWINPHFGEWQTTGLMTKESAEAVKKHLGHYHEQVTIYRDNDEG